MSTKVMVDIETLGLQPSSVILSIGAVVFDSHMLGDFYVELKHNQPGRTCDLETINWWNQQTIPIPNGTDSLYSGLDKFRSWVNQIKASSELEIWANGTDFDITILTHAVRQLDDFPVPWKYNAVRDYRTLYKLFPEVKRPEMDSSKKHNALEDAKHQAAHAELIFAHIRSLRSE